MLCYFPAKVSPEDAVTNCVMDNCATFSDESLCNAFSSYAADCAVLNVRPQYFIEAAQKCSKFIGNNSSV